MQQANRSYVSWQTLAVVSAILAIVVVGIVLVDKGAGLAAALGIGIAWLGFALVHLVRARRSQVAARPPSPTPDAAGSSTKRRVIRGVVTGVIVAGLILAAGCVAAVIFLRSVMQSADMLGGAAGHNPGGGNSFAPSGICTVTYQASETTLIFDGSDVATDTITLHGTTTGDEDVTYYGDTQNMDPSCPPEGKSGPVTYELSPVPVTSKDKGWLLHEVRVLPDALSHDPQLRHYDASQLNHNVSVELRNFPQGVFFQARGASDVKSSNYVDTETVAWQQSPDDPGYDGYVTFSYVTPGWQFTRPALAVFYGVQSVDQLIVGAASTIGTVAASVVFDVTLSHYVKEPLDNLIFKSGKVLPRAKKEEKSKASARKRKKAPPKKPVS